MNNISNDTPLTLQLTVGDAYTIMAGLSELPAKYSRYLMDNIEEQTDKQCQTKGVIKPNPSQNIRSYM